MTIFKINLPSLSAIGSGLQDTFCAVAPVMTRLLAEITMTTVIGEEVKDYWEVTVMTL